MIVEVKENKIDLVKYLPDYYWQSPQMKEIMRVSAMNMLDIMGDPNILSDPDGLWKIIFFKTTPDEYLQDWFHELDVSSKEEAVIKLSTTGTLSMEMIRSNGFRAIETYNLGVPHDGIEYGRLISWILYDPKDVDKVKKLIDYAGMAGFKYILIPTLTEKVAFKRMKPSFSMEKHIAAETNITKMIPQVKHSATHISLYVDVRKKYTWLSPLTFLDNVNWTDTNNTKQYSEISKIKGDGSTIKYT